MRHAITNLAVHVSGERTAERKRARYNEMLETVERFMQISAQRYGARVWQNEQSTGRKRTAGEMRASLAQEVEAIRDAVRAGLSECIKVLRRNVYTAELHAQIARHPMRDCEIVPLPLGHGPRYDAQIQDRRTKGLEGERITLRAKRMVDSMDADQILVRLEEATRAGNVDEVSSIQEALQDKHGKDMPAELEEYFADLEQRDFWGITRLADELRGLQSLLSDALEDAERVQHPMSEAEIQRLEQIGVDSGARLMPEGFEA